jgi:protein-L-isoaspartate(D-aspartate) O-methyltransferase
MPKNGQEITRMSPIGQHQPARESDAAEYRRFYAQYITLRAGTANARLLQAFANTPREPFAGTRPWQVPTAEGYVAAPPDDPYFLYQDVVIALDAAKSIHCGKPSLHAKLLARLAVPEGSTILHLGAGSGYYTAILAELTGPKGRVIAYEIEPGLAARAAGSLAAKPWVEIIATSATTAALPDADLIYVNTGVFEPAPNWIAALNPGGRLLFPLQSPAREGAMVLATRPPAGGAWPLEFITQAGVALSTGTHDAETGQRLLAAFRSGRKPLALRFDAVIPDECWFAGEHSWISRK